jgi:hypothetical protein
MSESSHEHKLISANAKGASRKFDMQSISPLAVKQ